MIKYLIKYWVRTNMSHKNSVNRKFLMKCIIDSCKHNFYEDNQETRQQILSEWLKDAESGDVIV
jgi:predicted transcriptional regulator